MDEGELRENLAGSESTYLVSLCSSLLSPDTDPAGVVLLLLVLPVSDAVRDDVFCGSAAFGALASPSSSPGNLIVSDAQQNIFKREVEVGL